MRQLPVVADLIAWHIRANWHVAMRAADYVLDLNMQTDLHHLVF
jgi:hypothetical protein